MSETKPDSKIDPQPKPDPAAPEAPPPAPEIGGRKGPEPTRFNDWEKGGRCIDF